MQGLLLFSLSYIIERSAKSVFYYTESSDSPTNIITFYFGGKIMVNTNFLHSVFLLKYSEVTTISIELYILYTKN